ncbi:hypothetical protein MCOR25_004805 [Pyricularia grisea]|uniref:Zn(2)-C6 fungal-type domain-containing protein n=1 Tax=Pyricularia grisea TaxID=148305 RepID=A0A6P8ATF6_PYRGI|nr:uncharacterized protein PgNI_09656 [Pyricularia grisea]KAI6367840.1 hypothetical protein MCOR25_004805 [Pyricularia grisea]TLD05398.1 hypothetical protein PgNI_09656 [Pyricularia grisea]
MSDSGERRRPPTEPVNVEPREKDPQAEQLPATEDDGGNEDDPSSMTAAADAANRSSKRGKIGRRACDGCKVRKIRCSELPPCERCVKIGIACTFNHVQALRGPRSLREKTIRRIKTVQEAPSAQQQQQQQQQPQQQQQQQHTADEPRLSTSPVQQKSPTTLLSTLVYLLCTYRLRLFSVWPIVAVEEVMADLHRNAEDLSTYALANAIAAATVAQLKLDCDGQTPSSSTLEAEARRARRAIIDGQGDNDDGDNDNDEEEPLTSLDSLRTTFFLHIFHENQKPGGAKSLMYLREAITIAQMMRLHDEASYSGSSGHDQMMRRRILWLLFVTERGVAVLHGLPVVLNPSPNARFPSLGGFGDRKRAGEEEKDDEAHILPAFRKLIDLFWIFDRSGAFEMLGESGGSNTPTRPVGAAGTPMGAVPDAADTPPAESNSNKLQRCFALLRQHQFHDDQQAESNPSDAGVDPLGDVQKADVLVTQLWMQAVLWKLLLRRRPQHRLSEALVHTQPLQIATDLIRIVDCLPAAALESHGPTMELKIFDIASAVVDQLSMSSNARAAWHSGRDSAEGILSELQRILSGCRGGNTKLLALLRDKIEAQKSYVGHDRCVIDQGPGLRHSNRFGTIFEHHGPSLGHGQVLSYQESLEGRVRDAFDNSSRAQLYNPVGQGLHMTQVSAGDMLLGMSSDVEGLQVPIDGMADSGAALFAELASNGGFMWDGNLSGDRIGVWPACVPN